MKKLTVVFITGVLLLCLAVPALCGEIHRAIEADDIARVQQILERDPSAVSQRDDGQFRELPIHIAAATGNIEIAKLLLDAGADIDGGDSDNSTALGVAAMRKQGEMVAFLIERGADVNRRDRKADCPLSFAVYGRDEAIIQQLLDAGADLYFRNPNGETLLHISCARGVRSLVEHLLDNGAEIDARSANLGTPLGYAAMQGHPEIVQLLLDRGANPNPGEPGEVTPLMFTTWRNQVECARILLENGADVDHPAHANNTPLLIAAESPSADMVTLLIENGAAVNHVNETGENALVKAAMGGYVDNVKALLTANADPNVGSDAVGRSAFQLAAVGGHTEVARELLSAGAKLNAATPDGDTPLELARYYGHGELAAMLADNGAKAADSNNTDRSLSALGKVGKKEAVVWFLGHSGWAVKTRNHLLIFDYYPQGEDPANPSLCNGHVNPAEIANEKVAVFASHHHGDHFAPAIFEWRNQVSDITYFLGLQPQDAPPYEYLPERMEKSFGDIEVTTIHSTDAGVGIVVEVDGLTIFHPGDHANGKIGLMEEFTDEIDFLADKGIRPDICFMGIRGCSLGRPDEVKEGIYYTLKTLKPKVFIPMHAGAVGHLYREFIEEGQGQFESIQMVAADNRGDHFVYKKGKIKDPKETATHQARAEGGNE
ncbi:MAG: ankyrin repeat domain-containing protein [Candidatus Latescibacterota bacterium]|nr:MAG: ankyrin repeat domain-containing protein [Candidatus Latescibacterota bacterium]